MNQLDRQQKRFSFAMGFALFHFLLNPVLLFWGLCAAGAGHGDGRLWEIAMISCFLFNLTLLTPVLISFSLRKDDKEMAVMFYFLLTLFVAYAGLSLWVVLNPGKI